MKRSRTAAALGVATVLGVASTAWAAPPGLTIDLVPDASERGGAQRSWKGKAWLHPSVSEEPERPRPLMVFMHGLNAQQIPNRWMGAAVDPDLRDIVSELIATGAIEPAIVAAPATMTATQMPRLMWPAFSLSRFLALTLRTLEGRATVDRRKIVLVGHSGAGCNTDGGMLAAVRSEVALRAVLVIDTCMDVYAAPLLALAAPETDVVVSWQPVGWQRPFDRFERVFLEVSGERHARGLRTVERWDLNLANAHNLIVAAALGRWLPRWLPGPSSTAR